MFARVRTLFLLGTLLSGCYRETFVVFPQWDVQLTDRSGAALADVPLYAYAWSQPHSRLDAEATYRSDAAGHISAAEKLNSKITAPFVLHGVSYPYLSFCVSTPGYRTLVGTLSDLEPGRPLTLTLPLSPGESFTVCDDFDEVRFSSGERRDDVAAQNGGFSSIYEVTGDSVQSSARRVRNSIHSGSVGR